MRRLHSILLALPLACVGLRAAEAEMRPVTIENTGTKPIYKLFGWPKEFVPRTFNLLLQPIQPGDSIDVTVEDAYGSCVFAFQADFNNPRAPLRPIRVKPKFLALAYQDDVNLCGPKTPKVKFK